MKLSIGIHRKNHFKIFSESEYWFLALQFFIFVENKQTLPTFEKGLMYFKIDDNIETSIPPRNFFTLYRNFFTPIETIFTNYTTLLQILLFENYCGPMKFSCWFFFTRRLCVHFWPRCVHSFFWLLVNRGERKVLN